MAVDLTDRQRRILARLVSEYIEQGEPVSSSWLAGHSGLGLSSATVRNLLARLEEQGLVRQPHTSAGRIPTDAGYRLYVDSLLHSRRRQSMGDLENRLRRSGTSGDLMENVSHELARASHQIAFAMTPASPAARLQHITFVSLDSHRVLIIVVASGNQITHKMIETQEPYDTAALEQAAQYINAEFAGLTLHEAREAIIARMHEDRLLYDALLARALRLAQTGLDEVTTPEDTLHVQGVSFLFEGALGGSADREQVTLETIRALFKLLEEKHRLVQLLTSYIEADGLTVVIGSEHTSPDMHPFSLVASTFHDGQRTGTVGVIGPTRMRYQRAITVVDGVSQAMTRVLEGN